MAGIDALIAILVVFLGWAAPIILIVLLVVRLTNRGDRSEVSAERSALAILEERYARGDIDRDDYLQRRADLGG